MLDWSYLNLSVFVFHGYNNGHHRVLVAAFSSGTLEMRKFKVPALQNADSGTGFNLMNNKYSSATETAAVLRDEWLKFASDARSTSSENRP